MKKFLGLIGPGMLLLLWYGAGELGILNELYIPRLEDVARALVDQTWQHGAFVKIGYTLYRTLVAFILAAVVAIPVGALIGMSSRLRIFANSIIEFFRALPAPTLFPIFLLFFGLGETTKILVATFVIFWIIIKQTILGVQNVSRVRLQVGKIYGASRLQMLFLITIRDAWPYIISGLRTALPLCLIVVIVAEMFLGGGKGIGQKIIDSYSSYQIPDLYAYIILTGLLGCGLDVASYRLLRE